MEEFYVYFFRNKRIPFTKDIPETLKNNGSLNTTTISYTLPPKLTSQRVSLKLYDMYGCEIATLFNEMQSSGHHKIQFNATTLTSGIYFYKLQVGNRSVIKKMVVGK
jgi:hypothetical protein